MARSIKKRKPDPTPGFSFSRDDGKASSDLRVKNYSEYTIKNRRVHIGFFIDWCHDRGLTEPTEVTRPILEHSSDIFFITGRRMAIR